MSALDIIMETNPWETVDDAIDKLISKRVLELHPDIKDDDLSDVLDDWGNRADAIDDLVSKLIKMRKELE
jgi:hypothetical protein